MAGEGSCFAHPYFWSQAPNLSVLGCSTRATTCGCQLLQEIGHCLHLLHPGANAQSWEPSVVLEKNCHIRWTCERVRPVRLPWPRIESVQNVLRTFRPSAQPQPPKHGFSSYPIPLLLLLAGMHLPATLELTLSRVYHYWRRSPRSDNENDTVGAQKIGFGKASVNH